MRQTMDIEPMPVATLRPHPGNPRTHSKRQIRQIADSIQRFGFTNPVLIGSEGEIIAGHGRVAADGDDRPVGRRERGLPARRSASRTT